MCGQRARQTLVSLIQGRTVSCEWNDTDRYGRRLSTCMVDQINLNAAMVYTGYAIAYRKYSKRYVSFEQEAKANKNGIWNGEFVAPTDHRKSGRKLRPF